MSKESIAVTLYRMKRQHEELASISGQLFSADELLSMFFGREVTESEGKDFICGDLKELAEIDARLQMNGIEVRVNL